MNDPLLTPAECANDLLRRLDNYEWGRWEPALGLVAVDRETFARTPKPSLAWLGGVARENGWTNA